MRRIAVINQKGGVGKTTTAVNLGAALALRDRSVLLLDIDPQANLSLHLNIDIFHLDLSIYQVLLGQSTDLLSLFIAPTAMTDRAFFDAQVSGLEEWIKSSAPAEDATGPILLPGEVERKTRAERLANGVPLDAGTRADVVKHAATVGVDAAALLS